MSTNELLAFVDRLNRSRLLDAARLQQVTRQLLPASADAEALARALIARRWLTAPQARDLLAGRSPAAPAAAARRPPAAPPRRTPWGWLAAGLLAVAVVVGLVLLIQHLRQRPAAPGDQQLAAGANPGTEGPDDAGGKLRRLPVGAPVTPPPPPAKLETPPPVTATPEPTPIPKPVALTPESPPIPRPPTLPEIHPGITYLFNDTLAAQERGVPALIPTDPLSRNGFETATVFGHTQRVYRFSGNANPTTEQAGLTFDNSSGLLADNNYSLEIVFEFLQVPPRLWRRIVDVQDRQSDNGFYVDPANRLDVYPLPGSGALFTTGEFHHIVLTNANTGTVAAYLNGERQLTGSTDVMNINNPKKVMHFFLDDFPPSAWPYDFSDGKIALLRLYTGVLSDEQVARLAAAVRGSPAAPTAPAAPAAAKNVAPDPGTLAGLQTPVGQTYYFRVTGSATGSIWGTDVYTVDSALATAAVHAGVLRPGETGVVRVQGVTGLSAYPGSSRNGVTSGTWGAFPAAYAVSRAGPD